MSDDDGVAVYRSKVVEFEAVQLPTLKEIHNSSEKDIEERIRLIGRWIVNNDGYVETDKTTLTILDFNGDLMSFSGPGDWIIRDLDGQFYAYQDAIFQLKYEEKLMGKEYYDEETLFKVRDALSHMGWDIPTVQAVITEIQNAGILFRERDAVEDLRVDDTEVVEDDVTLIPLESDQWRDGDGVVMPLCVIHELNPDFPKHVQAMATIGGLSVCKLHLGRVGGAIARGEYIGEILQMAMKGDDQDVEKG